MKWLKDLLGGGSALDEAQAARLAAWRGRARFKLDTPLADARLVVVDVESSGLDLNRDRLLAIGAVAIEGGRVVLADSLDIVLRQELASSHDNILIHGIGGQAQCAGKDRVEALLDFLDYLGASPLIAFHAAFDRGMIDKALRTNLGLRLDREWVDLAHIAPALHPDLANRCRTLDQWTAHFGIDNFARHSALADALATAQLLLALMPGLQRKNLGTFRALRDLSDERERLRS